MEKNIEYLKNSFCYTLGQKDKTHVVSLRKHLQGLSEDKSREIILTT